MRTLEAGDTFIIAEPGTSLDSHLWMVISEPTASAFVLLVNLTTFRADKDLACVLDVGDHPFIKHQTCVNYQKAKLIATAQLEKVLQLPHVKTHAKLTPQLLQKIRNASANSQHMELDMFQFLDEQGVVGLGIE